MTNNQIEMGISDSNELILIESRTMRDQHVYRDSILEKVKAIPKLPNTLEITLQMAATYYDVGIETVRSIIKRNRDEFNEYEEIRLLKGKSLTEFKTVVQDEPSLKGINSLQLLNRRGLLRLGMLLTDSEVAKVVRNYLLNVEEVSTDEQKRWAVEREISKRERRMLTDSIQEFYHGTLKSGLEYPIFTNLVYSVLFDLSAKQLKEMYDIGKGEALRDAFTTEDLRRIVDVERSISVLIKLGRDYKEIKAELFANKDRY